ncbi:HPr family phosphocarrier protein [Dactylosporangium sp. NPDC000555]|uniref:HPr family phosphocarrier protein n=1 Tax=Dactylosporangium sp. NPDC000555 TaxID=3154260 RepID=UPI0033315F64
MSASSERCVVLPEDLHARPAGALVRVAARFRSTVEVIFNEKRANARSVLAIMGLNATAGSTVRVHAHGDDADEAAAAVVLALSAVA